MSDTEAMVRAACSSDPAPAVAMLTERAAMSSHDVAAGCVAGDAEPHCNHPEGGPTMQTVGEIPRGPYAEIVRTLLQAGAPVPARLRWEGAPPPEAMVSELLRGNGA